MDVPLLDIERALISALLAEPRTIIPVWGVIKPEDIHDKLCRQVYDTCLNLAHAGKVPNPYTVVAEIPSLTIDVLLDLQSKANPQIITEVLSLADIIRQEAVYRRVAEVTESIRTDSLTRPKDVNGFIFHSITMLSMAVEGQSDRPAGLTDIGREVDAEIADDNVITSIPTGFGWLTDRIGGGFKPGQIIALIAPYKSRKSTVARNMALAAARANKQVGMFALEGERKDIFTDMWAMLATERLHRWLDMDDFAIEGCLDGLHLRAALRTANQHKALVEARAELNHLGQYIRVCDGRDGITNLERFNARITRDKFLYNTDMIIVDHMQLMNSRRADRLFENVEATVGLIQNFAVTEGVVAVILSQQNEATIGLGGSSYSPGAKGGGALPAAADHILISEYDAEKSPDVLRLRLKHSRRAQPGYCDYAINPSSGLILSELH